MPTRDEVLSRYCVRPELDMQQWGRVLRLLAATDGALYRELMEAMCEDEASPDVPAEVFGLLMER